MEQTNSLGSWLRRRRKALDLTQGELARQVGCAVGTIKKLEGDERRPSRQMAERLANCLEIPAAERAAFLKAARAELAADRLNHTGAPSAVLKRRRPPRPLTPFIGRAHELSNLLAHLRDPTTRLVTLVAPGGMGKTRLALAAAERLQSEAAFPDGAAFVALAPVSEPAGLDPTLADALGLPLGAGGQRALRAQLLDYLRAKQLLLILDNCEHLTPAVGELARAILADAPDVTILATSRERLELRAAHVLALDGMVAEADGIELFTASACSVRSSFMLDDATRPQVAAICARLGGMPLAIELAAGWADTLSVAEIAAELQWGGDLLVSQAADLEPRHHSVRTICDATWSRLMPQEQAIFAQMAIFRGGGTRQALQLVTGASLDQLHALVGKALLYYHPERQRYTVHELLRQYAAEQLEANAEAWRGAQDRHATYYLKALAAHEPALKGAAQTRAMGEIGNDIENAHAAWLWAAADGAADLLAEAIGSLSLAYEWLGRSEDGLGAMRQGRAANPPPDLQVRLLAAQARFAFLRGDQAEAGVLLTQAQAICAAHAAAVTGIARAEVLLQQGRWMAGHNFDAAHDAFTRSQALFEASNSQWGAAMALAELGVMTINLSADYTAARRFLDQSVARFRALGEQNGLSEALTNLSMAARYLGDQIESLALSREAYALAQATGNLRLIARAASNLGAALFWNGANQEAQNVLITALSITIELGYQADLPNIYFRLGAATKLLGRYAEARKLLTAGLAIAQQGNDEAEACAILCDLSLTALAEGAYEEALRLAEQCIALSERLGEAWMRLIAYPASALAARGLGEPARAYANALAGLRFVLSMHSPNELGLWAIALVQADAGQLERAATTMALADRLPPISNRWLEDIGLRELRASLATLPPVLRPAAQARWAQHDFLSGLQQLIAELEAEGWGA